MLTFVQATLFRPRSGSGSRDASRIRINDLGDTAHHEASICSHPAPPHRRPPDRPDPAGHRHCVRPRQRREHGKEGRHPDPRQGPGRRFAHQARRDRGPDRGNRDYPPGHRPRRLPERGRHAPVAEPERHHIVHRRPRRHRLLAQRPGREPAQPRPGLHPGPDQRSPSGAVPAAVQP